MKVGKIVGRDRWLEQLLVSPSPVTLIRAPSSTGKRTVALAAARRAGVEVTDMKLYPPLEQRDEYGRPIDPSNERAEVASTFELELTITHVRDLIAWSRKAPMASPFKVAIVRLDNVRPDGSEWRASARTLASMLKLLEEPPATTRFVLLATQPTMPMIRSRAVELTGGLLSPEQVEEIVFAVSDLSEVESRMAGRLGGGRVQPSIDARGFEGSVQAVVDVLTSLRSHDQVALTEKSRIWSDADTEMLIRWAHERITNNYVIFAGSGAPEVSVSAAERVLRTVARHRGARPRILLGAVAALAGG
ncbi:MAG: hypothetical protein WC054_00495 [Candidatus Nanopelagicales bacterium]